MSLTTSQPAASPATPPWPGTRADGVAKLEIGGKTIELPVIVGSEGEHGLDIAKLRAQSGAITLDEGFVNTGSTTSAITYLDGENGILRYRGYPIEVLAEKCDFVEVAHLLIYGKLPNVAELDAFRTSLSHHTMIHEDMRNFYTGFPRDA
ncbi:MAG: citrate (Si)-synthase, partial [Planctomycetia bacterium]|nr:citrate (Si)-synthase [Planctomycetia bacterium]